MTATIRRLIEDLHALPHRDPAVLQELFRQYHCELLALDKEREGIAGCTNER